MRAGQLKDFVTIQRPVAQSDSAGQRSEWEVHVKAYAEVVQLQGKELVTARQVFSSVTTRVRMRYLDGAGVDASMQVLVDGRVLDILSAIDLNRKHETLELMCGEAA